MKNNGTYLLNVGNFSFSAPWKYLNKFIQVSPKLTKFYTKFKFNSNITYNLLFNVTFDAN
jgi:hypothetical protein